MPQQQQQSFTFSNWCCGYIRAALSLVIYCTLKNITGAHERAEIINSACHCSYIYRYKSVPAGWHTTRPATIKHLHTSLLSVVKNYLLTLHSRAGYDVCVCILIAPALSAARNRHCLSFEYTRALGVCPDKRGKCSVWFDISICRCSSDMCAQIKRSGKALHIRRPARRGGARMLHAVVHPPGSKPDTAGTNIF